MRRDTAAPRFGVVPFVECVCLPLALLCEMQVRALCFEEIVCVPGSLWVIGWFLAVLGDLQS